MNFRLFLKSTLSQWFIWLLLITLAACNPQPAPSPTPSILAATATPSPVALPSPTPTALPPTPLPSPTPAAETAETGTVKGRVCYPGSRTPPMTLYLENTSSGAVLEQEILPDQTNFSLTAPPGEYIAYAQTVGTGLTGLYSEAVVCGSGEDCTDHQPRPFQVNPQQPTAGIDLCDWYSPPGIVAPSSGQNTTSVWGNTLQKVNLFAGPGLAYDILGVVPARTLAKTIGRSGDKNWLQLDYKLGDNVTGWVYAPLLQIIGAPDALPVVEAPPLPIPAAPATLAPATDQFIPAVWSAEANAGLMHLKGFIRDKAGRPVNGFSILADNGTWSVLSHPSGPSNWYPDQDAGEWDLVVTNVTDAVGWWSLTVVTYDCPGFEQGFNAQCKQFTRLSENQVIKIVYPDETVINADWICQRDCDKGLKLSSAP